MAMISVGGATASNTGRYYVSTWVREDWGTSGKDWTLAEYLDPVSLVEKTIHGRSAAVFRYNYGSIKREDRIAFEGFGPQNTLRDLFVCIRVQPPIPLAPYTLWCGVIPAEQLRVHGTTGPTGSPPAYQFSGEQTFTAYGLEYLLERRALINVPVIDTGVAEPADSDYSTSTHIPTFNQKTTTGMGDTGNRSPGELTLTGPPAVPPVYGFALDGVQWTHKQIAELLMVWTDDYSSTAEPHFVLGGADSGGPLVDDVLDFLDSMVSTFQPPRNVLDGLRQLIDPTRGLAASVVCGMETAGDLAGFPDGGNVEIRLHTTTDVNVAVGTSTLPANPDTIDLVLDADRDIQQAAVRIDAIEAYDEIVVRGERVVSCFSAGSDLKQPSLHPTSIAEERNLAPLSEGWLVADETAYIAATDAQRKTLTSLARVFRVFRLGHLGDPFDWETEGAAAAFTYRILHPAFNDDGVRQLKTNSSFGNLDCRMLRELPIARPADVSDAVWDARFKKPTVICELLDDSGVGTGAWVNAHAPPTPDETWENDAGETVLVDREDVSATVTVSDRGMELDVKFADSPHVLGANTFTATNTDTDPVFDFYRMIATVAVETDERPMVVVSTGVSSRLGRRRRVIDVPGAHVWFVHPNTIVGIDANGKPVTYTGNQVARDDTDLLRATAAVAKAYYGRTRATLTITRRGVLDELPLGTFVNSALYATRYSDIGSVVTERKWNFARLSSTISTGIQPINVIASR